MTKLFFGFFIIYTFYAKATTINNAYSALNIHDYFKAKQLFYKALKKQPTLSAFGLSVVYYRTDNPFSNIDSAAKYIHIAHVNFKDSATHHSFKINKQTIDDLKTNISNLGYEKYVINNDVKSINNFLSHFYFADTTLIKNAFYRRDNQLLEYYSAFNVSDSLALFILKYPQTSMQDEAKERFYKMQFLEQTKLNNITNYKLFLKKYPSNPYAKKAEQLLYELIKQEHQADKLHDFIINYSTSTTKNQAWKTLYGMSVKSYNITELNGFINKYPNYPFIDEIYKEISLAGKLLIPLKNSNDNYGFIDTLGKWVITPIYDDVTEFKEGIAVVCKNDSCYYINKDGLKLTNQIFEEAENYYKGIAIVKTDSLYYLLNKAGQIVSKGYQLINAPSQDLYVCKENNLYGAINSKGNTIIPFIYQKLGDFKNGFAYYQSTKYGLIDINNKTTPANWDWISDIDSNLTSVVKKGNQFGLINLKGEIKLPTQYDFINQTASHFYIVVKNGLYGFYDIKNNCFIANIDFDYKNSILAADYSNGIYFKLFKGTDFALQDANGKLVTNFGAYSNVFFSDSKLIRVQKNNKYGFADKKLKMTTPFDYEKATDFTNQYTAVEKNNTAYLINENMKSVFLIKQGSIELLKGSSHYLVKQNDLHGLINKNGQWLLAIEYDEVSLIMPKLILAKKNSVLYLLNLNNNQLIKL